MTIGAMWKFATALSLCATAVVHAADNIPESWFTDNQGLQGAQAAAPMWHMASGSCLPSAAEDGQGHQTDGVNPGSGECLVAANLGKGCPGDNSFQGANTFYGNVDGEPFGNIPTYWAARKCPDNSWNVYYGVYFKKDVGHKSDWEFAITRWVPDGSGKWARDSVSLEVDGKRGGGRYSDIPNTFTNADDRFQDGNQGRNHPKFYFGKHHHAVHWDTSGNFKSTCPPVTTDDFRANDFQFWAFDNLRHIDNIDPNWTFGQATNPHDTVNGIC